MRVHSRWLVVVLGGISFGCSEVPVWQPADVSGKLFAKTVCANSHLPLGSGAVTEARRKSEITWLANAGISCLRLDFLWREIEPARGQFEFEDYDEAVDALAAVEIDVLALMTYATPWAIDGDADSTIAPQDFANFAGRTASHFAGRVRHYEIWNEPNFEVFWRPEPDPHAYGALLKASSAAIRDADSDAQVVLGGNLSIAGMFKERLWDFLFRLAEAHPGIDQAFDILSYHPYTYLQQARPEQQRDGDVWPSQMRMTEQLHVAGDAMGLPTDRRLRRVWNTETGWSSLIVTEEQQALYIVRAVLISAALGVERFHMFNAIDSDPDAPGLPLPAEAHYGLVHWDPDPLDDVPVEPKPAYLAIRRLLEVTAGLHVVHDAEYTSVPEEDGLFMVMLATNEKLVWIVWHSERMLAFEPATPSGWQLSQMEYLLSGMKQQLTAFPAEGTVGTDPLMLTYIKK